MRGTLLYGLAAVGLAAAPIAAARADLVLVSPNVVVVGGTGLGTVNTVLTIQSSGSSTTEAGCVSYNGTTDLIGSSLSGGQCTGSSLDVKTGSSQTQTRTLAEAGITSASNFALFLNSAEPSADAITLNTLVVSFYNAAGAVIHTATYSGPHTFPQTAVGTGNSGFEFVLNSTQASQLQTFINSLGLANIRVGITSSLSDATGGNETFFIFNANLPTQITPEPSTTALMATGLFGLVGFVRRRRRNS